jgi:ribosomal protein S24E
MDILERKESKLLGRTEVRVHFGEKSGALSRSEAVKMVADQLKVEPANVGIVALRSGSGSRALVGLFHVYDSKDSMKIMQEKHLGERLLTKEQREALKQAKKQAKQPKAK